MEWSRQERISICTGSTLSTVTVRPTSDSWRIRKARGCCVYAWKRNELSRGTNGAKRKWQGNSRNWRQKKKSKRSRREHGSVKNSLTLPSRRHASAKKKYVRWAKGGFWPFGSDLTSCRLWQAEGFEAMEEGVRAIAKTSNFQSEHVRLKTIFFARRPLLRQGIWMFFCWVDIVL